MSEYFNKLSPGQLERLAWLSEELGEVQQAIGKILRHGYDSYDPTNPDHKGNRADLERECMDVLKAIYLLSLEHDIRDSDIFQILTEYHKILKKSNKYFHHQE